MRSRRTQIDPGAGAGMLTELSIGCPSCAAPLQLDEDDVATTCPNCERAFLLTNEGRTPRYYLRPAIDTADAATRARAWLRDNGHRATHIGQGSWVMAPYWRCRAKALRWYSAQRQVPVGTPSPDDVFRDLAVRAMDFTFAASRFESGLDNLGTRPSMLTSYPYHDDVKEWAQVVHVRHTPPKARRVARQRIDAGTQPAGVTPLHERLTVVQEHLSILYFPFFVLLYQFRDHSRHVVIDGIDGSITMHGEIDAGSLSALSERGKMSEDEVRARDQLGTLSFIPAKCPVCRGNLDAEEQDRIRMCRTCNRAWEQRHEFLREVRQHVVDNGVNPEEGRLLPFWAIDVTTTGWSQATGPRNKKRMYVPAFENRHIERTCQLGIHLTRACPRFADLRWRGSMSGCTVTLGDATRMVWVMMGTMASADAQTFERFIEHGEVTFHEKRLLWIPFRTSGLYLREPLSGALVREASTRPWGPIDEEMAA